MAPEPKRTDEPDNIVSLRDARARQAEAQAKAKAEAKIQVKIQAKAGKTASGRAAPEKKIPALLIFLAMLALLVAYKFLAT